MAATKTQTPVDAGGELQALTVAEFCKRLSISHATAYNLMARGELKSFTIGKRRLVPIAELRRILSEAR